MQTFQQTITQRDAEMTRTHALLATIDAAAIVCVRYAQLCSPPLCAHPFEFVRNSILFNQSRLIHVLYFPVDVKILISQHSHLLRVIHLRAALSCRR